MRTGIAALGVVLLVLLAGCVSVGGPSVPGATDNPGSTGPAQYERPTEPAPLTPPPGATREPTPTRPSEQHQPNPHTHSQAASGGAPGGGGDGAGGGSSASGAPTAAPAPQQTRMPQATPAAQQASVGYSVGGAQDAHNFRENVREGYVPQPTDITYEGIFHDYYFDRGQQRPCDQLFCPSFSRAVTEDPLSNETERYVSVGLNSNITQEAFERKQLNLVVVLDTSGSMSSSFEEYYYDGGERKRVESTKPKMRAATDAVASMTAHLNAEDRLGIVTYDETAQVLQQPRRVSELDRNDLRDRLRRIPADGSTNLDEGMRTARTLVDPYANPDASESETRVIYVTDAMPNVGQTGAGGFQGRLASHADNGIYSTFVGVGVDFNSEIVEAITSTRGANYYTVKSPGEFDARMDEGFQYMVTPLVFNLELAMDATGYEIANVYGTTEEAESTGEILRVKTLFPSQSEGGRTKGGVILLELARTGPEPVLDLTASYEDRSGNAHQSVRSISFEEHEPPYFEGSGVRKAVALQRYATLMRNWAAFERVQDAGADPAAPEAPDDGIVVRPLGTWEHQSVDLRVSRLYKQRVERFREYLRQEKDALGDETLERELDLMATLLSTGAKTTTRTRVTEAD